MAEFPRSASSASPISVHVEVKGSLDIPLNLKMLSDLGDPVMEQEILKEAVRISVSEQLGYFDGLDVRLSSSGGREGTPSKPGGPQHLQQLTSSPTATTCSYTRRYCEVDVDLRRLGSCVEAIQKAYEDLLVQTHLVHDVLSGTGSFASPMVHPAPPCAKTTSQLSNQNPGSATSSSVNLFASELPHGWSTDSMDGTGGPAYSSTMSSPCEPASTRYADAVNRLAAARHIVERMLEGRQPSIVSEAAALQEAHQMCREADMLELERRIPQGTIGSGRGHLDHEDGVDAELRRGLLADDDEEELPDRGPENADDDDHDDDDLDEEALHDRYMKAGYTPL